MNPDKISLRLLGVEIGHLPSVAQFMLCCAGMFIFHCTHGYLQVSVFVHVVARLYVKLR